MSIIAVFVNDDCALVGVDTATFTPSGDAAELSKLVPLVHMGAVIAYRGCALFLETFFGMCHMQGGDFDALIDRMPAILTETSRAFTFNARQMGVTDPTLLESHNVVLVGWSARAGRICCLGYEQKPAAKEFVGQEYSAWYFAPGSPTIM